MTTLLEHPKVREALTNLTYTVGSYTTGVPKVWAAENAVVAAILAAVGEGEDNLDFSAAYAEASRSSTLPQYEADTVQGRMRDIINDWHRARVGALKARVAELEKHNQRLQDAMRITHQTEAP